MRSAREEAEKGKRNLLEALDALKPWTGGPEALRSVEVPGAAEMVALRDREAQARALRRTCADSVAQKSAEVGRLAAEAAAAARAADLVGDDEAAALRAARDAAWAAHRNALTAPTADAFEGALRRDDAAGAARLVYARELAAAARKGRVSCRRRS